MIDMLPLMLGAIAIVFFFLYIAFKLDESHFALKYLAFGFAIVAMFLIPKVALDQPYNCDHLLVNQTQITVDNVTTHTYYNYDYICGSEKSTPLSLQRIVIGFLTVFLIYTFVYVFKWLFENLLRTRVK